MLGVCLHGVIHCHVITSEPYEVLGEIKDYYGAALQGLINLGHAILIFKLVYSYLACHLETT